MPDPGDTCPLCRAALHEHPTVAVCQPCVDRLTGAPVRATGEFLVPSLPAVTEPTLGLEAPVDCAWCGRPRTEVRKLLGQRGVSICDGCVGLCVDILAAELGPDWR